MPGTLAGIAAIVALFVVAVLRGRRAYEQTMVVSGHPDDWVQKCSDALEGAAHFSDVRVYDDPPRVEARYRRPAVWGWLGVTLRANGPASTCITARARVAPTPLTAVVRPEPRIIGRLVGQLGLGQSQYPGTAWRNG